MTCLTMNTIFDLLRKEQVTLGADCKTYKDEAIFFFKDCSFSNLINWLEVNYITLNGGCQF